MLPSDMIDDRLVSMDRVIAIEATMDEMKSQHEATQQTRLFTSLTDSPTL